jgi:hypothetical protein
MLKGGAGKHSLKPAREFVFPAPALEERKKAKVRLSSLQLRKLHSTPSLFHATDLEQELERIKTGFIESR